LLGRLEDIFLTYLKNKLLSFIITSSSTIIVQNFTNIVFKRDLHLGL